MSYILDALKKAERERAIAQVPTLMSVHDTPSETPQKRPWIFAGICVLGALLLILAAIILLRQMESKPAPAPADQSDHAARQTQEPASETKDSPPQAAVPLEDSAGAGKPAESREIPAAAPSTQRPVPELNALPAPPSAALAAKPLARPVSGSANSAAPASESAPATETAQAGVASLRDAVAKMTMTIHMYSEDRSERMVFINDRKYLEGDYVEGHYLLQSITQEGAVLSFQGERAVLRPKAR